jgi:integrase
VLLPDVMTAQINAYIEYKRQLNLGSAFFYGGDKPVAQRTYQRYFAKYTDMAGIKHIRIHDLRHSHASMLIHLNVPITAISKRLGHSTVKMTLEKYAHCYSDSDSDAINIINSAINNFLVINKN